MPPGTHTITASRGDGKPITLTVTVTPETARTAAEGFAKLQAAYLAGLGPKPYIDLNHDDKEASGHVSGLFWAGEDMNQGGIRLRVEWSKAGAEAITGRLYRQFSPIFTWNEETKEIGVSSANMGGLVNRPAFRVIQPLFAAEGKPCGESHIAPEKVCHKALTATYEKALGQEGDWKAMGLPDIQDLSPFPEKSRFDASEARRLIERGMKVQDATGREIELSAGVLLHWQAARKTSNDEANRLRFLGQAIHAIESPHEIWQGQTTRSYIQAFQGADKKRFLAAWVFSSDNSTSSFVSTDKQQKANEWRKGRLEYFDTNEGAVKSQQRSAPVAGALASYAEHWHPQGLLIQAQDPATGQLETVFAADFRSGFDTAVSSMDTAITVIAGDGKPKKFGAWMKEKCAGDKREIDDLTQAQMDDYRKEYEAECTKAEAKKADKPDADKDSDFKIKAPSGGGAARGSEATQTQSTMNPNTHIIEALAASGQLPSGEMDADKAIQHLKLASIQASQREADLQSKVDSLQQQVEEGKKLLAKIHVDKAVSDGRILAKDDSGRKQWETILASDLALLPELEKLPVRFDSVSQQLTKPINSPFSSVSAKHGLNDPSLTMEINRVIASEKCTPEAALIKVCAANPELYKRLSGTSANN